MTQSPQREVIRIPSTPPAPSKHKKARFDAQETLPGTPQKFGVIDLVTTLRADTSFEENVWF
jgi:hypothetical protein